MRVIGLCFRPFGSCEVTSGYQSIALFELDRLESDHFCFSEKEEISEQYDHSAMLIKLYQTVKGLFRTSLMMEQLIHHGSKGYFITSSSRSDPLYKRML